MYLSIHIVMHYYYLKYLALNANQLIHGSRPEGTLVQAVKQLCSICFLTGHMLKEVQWGNVNSMKMISRDISSPLSFTYQNFSKWS